MVRPCKDCGVSEFISIDYREGNIVCQKCGLIQEQRIIDETSEERCFATDHCEMRLTRTGNINNTLLNDSGLST